VLTAWLASLLTCHTLRVLSSPHETILVALQLSRMAVTDVLLTGKLNSTFP